MSTFCQWEFLWYMPVGSFPICQPLYQLTHKYACGLIASLHYSTLIFNIKLSHSLIHARNITQFLLNSIPFSLCHLYLSLCSSCSPPHPTPTPRLPSLSFLRTSTWGQRNASEFTTDREMVSLPLSGCTCRSRTKQLFTIV